MGLRPPFGSMDYPGECASLFADNDNANGFIAFANEVEASSQEKALELMAIWFSAYLIKRIGK